MDRKSCLRCVCVMRELGVTGGSLFVEGDGEGGTVGGNRGEGRKLCGVGEPVNTTQDRQSLLAFLGDWEWREVNLKIDAIYDVRFGRNIFAQ